MSNKLVLIISGETELKNKFEEIVKANGYWVWNVSHMNSLSLIARKVGWNGERNKHYRNFINEFESLTERYFSYPKNYVRKILARYYDDEKANLMVIHGCDPEYAKELRLQDNIWALHLANSDPESPSSEWDKVIVGSSNYQNDVLTVLNTLQNIR